MKGSVIIGIIFLICLIICIGIAALLYYGFIPGTRQSDRKIVKKWATDFNCEDVMAINQAREAMKAEGVRVTGKAFDPPKDVGDAMDRLKKGTNDPVLKEVRDILNTTIDSCCAQPGMDCYGTKNVVSPVLVNKLVQSIMNSDSLEAWIKSNDFLDVEGFIIKDPHLITETQWKTDMTPDERAVTQRKLNIIMDAVIESVNSELTTQLSSSSYKGGTMGNLCTTTTAAPEWGLSIDNCTTKCDAAGVDECPGFNFIPASSSIVGTMEERAGALGGCAIAKKGCDMTTESRVGAKYYTRP